MIHGYQQSRITNPDTEMHPDRPSRRTHLGTGETLSAVAQEWGAAQSQSEYEWVTRFDRYNKTLYNRTSGFGRSARTKVRP